MSNRSGSGKKPRGNLLEMRKRDAATRLEAWSKLSLKEQLKALDNRPGESKRQRERLLSLIEKAKQKPVAEKAPEATVQEAPSGGRIKAKERHAQEQKVRPSK